MSRPEHDGRDAAAARKAEALVELCLVEREHVAAGDLELPELNQQRERLSRELGELLPDRAERTPELCALLARLAEEARTNIVLWESLREDAKTSVDEACRKRTAVRRYGKVSSI